MQELNKELLISLNSLLEFDFIKNIVLIFADWPIFFLPIFLIIMWIYYTYMKKSDYISNLNLTKNLLEKEKLLYIFYSTIIWIIISIIIQQFVNIDRPETAIEWVWQLILSHIPDSSFPSDHATVAIAFLTSLFLAWYKKIWYIFAPFAILMILSRVIVWVHWPFDIIAWSLVWIFSSFFTFKYLVKCIYVKKFNEFIVKIMWFIKHISRIFDLF